MKIYHPLFLLLLVLLVPGLQAYALHPAPLTRDIKSFGAKGDGKTNDHAAFERAAAFFNERGGHGRLIISKGTYLVGRQTFGEGQKGQPAYRGDHVLAFKGVENLTIRGEKGSIIRYTDGLRFGAFDPQTGEPYTHPKKYFVQWSHAGFIGHCILIESSRQVRIEGLEIDGNNEALLLGGHYGDTGRQLPHYGIFIKNSRQVVVDRMNIHHTALDGICVSNAFADEEDDGIEIRNSHFEYNGRQGFSWIGGKGLRVVNSAFNHSGRAGVRSAPGAGVDIEAEVAPIRKGYFENCSFINNTGCGLVADSGDSGDVTLKNSTFWGVTNWSIWVTKPAYRFENSTVYGSFVHGYDAPDDSTATRFTDCHFEDKAYQGSPAFGKFLVESNNKKRVSFERCTFVAWEKKLLWVASPLSWTPEEKYQFRHQDCNFEYQHPDARGLGYWLNACCADFNVDLGGNSITFAPAPEKQQ
jgi:hypothetical protein